MIHLRWFERLVEQTFIRSGKAFKKGGSEKEKVNEMTTLQETMADAPVVIRVTKEGVDLYKTGYELMIQETEGSGYDWDARREKAKKYAGDLVPSVREGLRVEMGDRNKYYDPAETLDPDSRELIRALLGWKVEIKNEYDDTPKTPPIATKSDSNGKNGGNGIYYDRGAASSWYINHFENNDILHARDSELCSIFSCTSGMFSYARGVLNDTGIEFEDHKYNEPWEVTKRPIDAELLRSELMDELEDEKIEAEAVESTLKNLRDAFVETREEWKTRKTRIDSILAELSEL